MGVKSFNKATKIKQTTRMISNQIVLQKEKVLP